MGIMRISYTIRGYRGFTQSQLYQRARLEFSNSRDLHRVTQNRLVKYNTARIVINEIDASCRDVKNGQVRQRFNLYITDCFVCLTRSMQQAQGTMSSKSIHHHQCLSKIMAVHIIIEQRCQYQQILTAFQMEVFGLRHLPRCTQCFRRSDICLGGMLLTGYYTNKASGPGG